jgi:hypothetical protein
MEDSLVEIACSFKLKGCMMPGHGSVLSVIPFEGDVHVLIQHYPIREPEAQAQYYAVAMPVDKCTEGACGDLSRTKGMTFEADTPTDAEELVQGWEILKAERNQRNRQITLDREKGKKKATTARRQVPKPIGAEVIAAVVEAGSPSKPKRKGKGKDDPNKVLKLTLDEALSRGNHLTMKTKDNEVTAIYQALETGLLHAFPYKKQRLPGVISADRLPIAPDELKYRKIAKDRLGQVIHLH